MSTSLIRIDSGGYVEVRDFEGLGTLKNAQTGESILRLLEAISGGDPNVAPREVNSSAANEMNKALTEALQQLVRDNKDAVPGVDLMKVLGVKSKDLPPRE
ncbi:MAG: hypothetical protein HN348_20100 [Proteobacteria bacterium]|jgi:hypothetical protein|nr:hypothetical protein [Pseudomonadota bacterium]